MFSRFTSLLLTLGLVLGLLAGATSSASADETVPELLPPDLEISRGSAYGGCAPAQDDPLLIGDDDAHIRATIGTRSGSWSNGRGRATFELQTWDGTAWGGTVTSSSDWSTSTDPTFYRQG